MFNKMMKNKNVFINSAVLEDNVGKIEMYGDVYEQVPRDWWTGEKLDVQCITLEEFKENLEKIKNCSRIQLHLNSYGGDATVGLTIRNLLKATGKHTTCIIEGIAASAAFTIASGCDDVQVYKGSLMMCHRVMQLCFGYYNNDELQQIMNGNDAYDNASAEVYAEKTGMSTQQCLNLMKKTTWMTGQQAIDYGFANTMLEGNSEKENVELINKTTLKVNGVQYDKLNIPENIIEKMEAHKNLGGEKMSLLDEFQKHVANFFQNNADNAEEQGTKETETVEAPVTKEAPVETPEVEKTEGEPEVVVAPKTEEAPTEEKTDLSKDEIINAERTRLQEIDAISSTIDADLIQEAKYSEKACDAKELAFRQMQRDSKKSQEALDAMKSDNADSKANVVSAEPPTNESDSNSDSEREQAINSLNNKIKEGK